ncbi:MAG TPA: CheR family methyltransferase [Mycobacteriales bacterium]|nr:CheR family methyltransferase [Mycobacteriales bacterium]
MTASVRLSDDDFARLRMLLAKLAGLVFDDTRRESLAYSVAERLRCTGVASVAEYIDRVSAPESPERQALLDEVTIQETHFFRNPPQIRALRAHVVPELVRAAAAGSRRLRVWSAGCSTGEEPYTVAMLLRELLPSTDGWDVQVVATDVSERALAAAREGVYGPRAVQLATPDELGRFFVARADGRYEVRPEVRSLVTFLNHNLVTDAVPFPADDRLDLVLCRNVTIYFSRQTTRALMGRLHGALRDGGYLFLGHAETLWQISDEFRLVALGTGDSAAFVYRRLDGPAGAVERRAVLPDRRTDAGRPPASGERRTAPRRAWDALARSLAPVRESAVPSVPRPPEPRSAADPLEAARSALAEGRYPDAASLAAVVAATEPLRADAHRLRGDALVALGHDDDALVSLRKALYLDPDDGMGHFQLAGALARQGHRAAAAREYRAAAAVLSRRPAALPAPELGGRTVGELVALCGRLGAELEARVLEGEAS